MTSYLLEISDEAEKDVREAFLWYENIKNGLGQSFKQDFLNAKDFIHQNPFKVQVRYQSIRVYFLKTYPTEYISKLPITL